MTATKAEEEEEEPKENSEDEIDPKFALSSYRISPESIQALKSKGVTALFPIQAGVCVCVCLC